MNRLTYAVAGLALLGSLSACGGDDTAAPGKPDAVKAVPCAELVGGPLATAFGPDELGAPGETRVTCSPDTLVSYAHGCAPEGYDEQTALRSWSADGGWYFGRTGGVLHFAKGEPDVGQMCDMAGDGS